MPLPQPVSKAVVDGDIKISCPGIRRARRKMFRCTGHGRVPGFAPICVDSNDPHTVQCGLLKRLCRDLPEPNLAKIAKLKAFVQKWVRKFVPKVRVLGFEEWLETTSYSEARKAELRLAYDLLKGGRPTKKEAQKVNMFVKSEAYESYKHARMINSRTDKVKCFLGPRFKAVEQAVFSLKMFIKHTPVPDRPRELAGLRAALRRYFLTDYTAYESHFTDIIMDAVECELYRHCLSDDEHVEFVCSILTGFNVLKTRTGIRCKLKARRMSGDMCTSLGNGFTNYMLTAFLLDEAGGTFEGFVEGDDGLFATTIELTPAMYSELGFTIKVVEVDDPCRCIPVKADPTRNPALGRAQGAFCGVLCSDSFEQIRDPRKFMCTFGWTLSFINSGQRIQDELARAKALSALAEAPQCPITSVMARRVEFETRGVTPRWVDDGFHTIPRDIKTVPKFAPSEDTRELFSTLYGISVPVQLEAEERISRGNFDLSDLIVPNADVQHYCARFVEVG